MAEAEARKLASTAFITSPAVNRTRNTIARVACCGSGRLGRPASEYGRLRHGDGDSEGGNRCRKGLVLTILFPAPGAASTEHDRLIANKLKEGYREVSTG